MAPDRLAANGMMQLIRHQLRRDRIFWSAWLTLLAVQYIATVAAYDGLYPTLASRLLLTTTIGSNPSLLALYGPAFDLSTAGGFAAWRIYGFALLMSGLMSIMAVVRNTRAEEETGRLELLRAGVVGRHVPLTATLLVTVVANAALGLLCCAGLVVIGEGVVGAVATALGFLVTGAVFAGVAAVTAQIPENARPARGMAVAVLGVSYLTRAIGDSSSTARWLSWTSPIGWAQKLRPYAHERWWVLAIPVAVSVGLMALAFALESRRDFASGLRPTRLGPSRANARLSSATGLAWRLQRGQWFAWVFGIAAVAGVLGAVANGVLDIFRNNPQLEALFRKMGGSTDTLIDTFFSAILPIVGMIATVHAVQAVLRVRSEETELRAEQVLATAATRPRVFASHVVHAVVSPFVLMAVAGLSSGAAYAATIHDSEQIGRIALAALATVPAMLVVAGLTAALLGVLPQHAGMIWTVLGLSALLSQIGPLLRLPKWSLRLSPYGNVPPLPGPHASLWPLTVLGALAAVLFVVGIVGYRRRDIGAA